MELSTKDKIKMALEPIYIAYTRIKYDALVKEVDRDPRRFIEKQYYEHMGKSCNIDNPVMYTDKIQKLKLDLADQFYSDVVDKVKVRDYLKNRFGDELIDMGLKFPRWYGVYSIPDEIEFDKLPNKFVLKTNHACGQVLICENKSEFNFRYAKLMLRKWISENYYYFGAEANYKNIKPLIFAEEYIDRDIIDYRIFCFHGEPYVTKVKNKDTENNYEHQRYCTYFNDWKKAPFIWTMHDGTLVDYDKPCNWEKMLSISRKLSEDFDLVRVDLYDVNGNVYFGELTLTPNGGFDEVLDDEWNKRLGDMI